MSETERQAKEIAKQLNMLGESYINKDVRARILGRAAEPVEQAVKNRVPIGRWARHNSLDGVKRSGTLKRSVQIFRSSRDRSVSAVLVGNVLNKRSRVAKVGSRKLSKARNNRAYYASIVLAKNKGTWRPFGGKNNQKTKQAYDFIKEGYRSSKAQASAIIIKEGEAILERFKRRYGF